MDAKRKLAANPELRAELGEAELRRVEERFDWNRKINRILDLYREGVLEYGRRLRPPRNVRPMYSRCTELWFDGFSLEPRLINRISHAK
jgi:hypothetical protein